MMNKIYGLEFLVNLFKYITGYRSAKRIEQLEEQGIVEVNGIYYSAHKIEKKPEELFLKVGANIYILKRIIKNDG